VAVQVLDRGAIRTITIDRPERRNALDPATSAALGAALLQAAADDAVRVLILTGAGDRAFCAGMDLRAFSEARDGGSPTPPSGPGPEVLTERPYPKPVIAAVNGAAVGGGFGLVLGCDVVVAAEHATFATPEVQRGLVGTGVTSRAALRLPPAIALELALTGEPIDAARAAALGIVNHVVPSGTELAAALALAERIAANAPMAVRVAKEIVYEARHLHDAFDLAALRAKAAPVIASDDAKEGARAFAERRPPQFKGR